MASDAIYRKQHLAFQTYYAEAQQLAVSQRRILSGTPGTLKQRTQSRTRYWVREHISNDGRKTDEYIGSVAATDKAAIEQLRQEIDLAKGLARYSARLRLLGYRRIDRTSAAVLAVLFNKGLFQHGLTVVGRHANAILLNDLGIIAPSYKTQDIGFARGPRLSVALPAGSTFQSLLRETGLNFGPIPRMPSDRPSSSFKLPGAEALAVDLLIPSRKIGASIPVPELATHAQAIPLLDFLVSDPVQTIALSPNQVIPIRVPSPENFVLHKIYSSQSRKSSDRGKVRKDLEQAAVLAAAIEEETPGRLIDAFKTMPRSGKPAVKRGCWAVCKLLGDSHDEAKAMFQRLGERA